MTTYEIEKLNIKNSFSSPTSKVDFHIWNPPITPLHRHIDYYEIFFITKGPINYTINGKVLTLNEGDLSIVRPSDAHMFYHTFSQKQAQHVNVACQTELFQTLANSAQTNLFDTINNTPNHIILHLSDNDYQHLNYLKRKVNLVSIEEKEQQKVAITLLLFNMLSIFALNSKIKEDIYPDWFFSLLQQISTPDFLNKSVKDVYKLCPYSPPIIIRTFKEYFNMSPVEYLTKIKIDYACNLLQNTDYTTLSISKKIGYTSLSHFNHIFKKLKNLTPLEYRDLSIK